MKAVFKLSFKLFTPPIKNKKKYTFFMTNIYFRLNGYMCTLYLCTYTYVQDCKHT